MLTNTKTGMTSAKAVHFQPNVLVNIVIPTMKDLINQHPIKKVTNILSVCDAMNKVSGAKVLCSELDRFLKLFLTIPVTIVSSERTFSVMRKLKNFLRSSMTLRRLTHVLLLHCHKLRTDKIDIHQIASSFITANERRLQYFGKL